MHPAAPLGVQACPVTVMAGGENVSTGVPVWSVTRNTDVAPEPWTMAAKWLPPGAGRMPSSSWIGRPPNRNSPRLAPVGNDDTNTRASSGVGDGVAGEHGAVWTEERPLAAVQGPERASGTGGDVVGEQVAGVGEVHHPRTARTQRPVQEGGHLSAGDGVVGTEPVVGGWVAAAGDAGIGEPFDVGAEHVRGGNVVEGDGGHRDRQQQTDGEQQAGDTGREMLLGRLQGTIGRARQARLAVGFGTDGDG